MQGWNVDMVLRNLVLSLDQYRASPKAKGILLVTGVRPSCSDKSATVRCVVATSEEQKDDEIPTQGRKSWRARSMKSPASLYPRTPLLTTSPLQCKAAKGRGILPHIAPGLIFQRGRLDAEVLARSIGLAGRGNGQKLRRLGASWGY